MRSGLRNRSNSKSNLSGSTVVMRSAYAMSDPAAEPRPADRNAAVASRLDEIVDDQEVPAYPVRVMTSSSYSSAAPLRRAADRRSALRPLTREVYEQVLIGGELRGTRILRQEVAFLEIRTTQLRDPRRLRQDVGPLAEQLAQSRLRLT